VSVVEPHVFIQSAMAVSHWHGPSCLLKMVETKHPMLYNWWLVITTISMLQNIMT